MPFKIEIDEFEALVVCALRYCQGRQTYMPSQIIEITLSYLDLMSTNTLKVIQHDCELQERYNKYGDELIDKPFWMTLRRAVNEELDNRKETKR